MDGAVYVFTPSAPDLSSWAQEGSIHATVGPGSYYNRMGYRIGKVGTTLFVGGVSRSSTTNLVSSSVAAFTRGGDGTWSLVTWVTDSTSQAYDGAEMHK